MILAQSRRFFAPFLPAKQNFLGFLWASKPVELNTLHTFLYGALILLSLGSLKIYLMVVDLLRVTLDLHNSLVSSSNYTKPSQQLLLLAFFQSRPPTVFLWCLALLPYEDLNFHDLIKICTIWRID
jgi:hypothetical protein